MIFQDPYASLNPRLNILQIMEEPLLIHNYLDIDARRKKIEDFIERVGLSVSDLKKYPHQFSGGQRQRIGIARALILEPKLVICDEPVSALDVSVQAQILKLLKDLQKEFGLTYLFITHDLRIVRHVADDVMVMRHGKLVEEGKTDIIFKNPKNQYTKDLIQSIPGLISKRN
jgi:peptide/nickel transport system ATP-binding protein/oligopeptide transport system ATP-binding protein